MWSSGIALIAVLAVLPTATRSATTFGPTVELTSTVCPSISCDSPFCNLEYIPGEKCPGCLCFDPKCMLEGCPDGQQCLPTGECDTCYACLPKFETTTTGPDTVESSTTGPTSTVCPSITCAPPLCKLEYIPGEECPFCICFEPLCMIEGCPPGLQCLPTGQCDTCYECLPKYGTTTATTNTETTTETNTETATETNTETATETTNTETTTWSINNCGVPQCGPYCPNRKIGINRCPACDCHREDACKDYSCPEGQECVSTEAFCNADTCFYRPDCYLKNDDTTTLTSTPTQTTSPCSDLWCGDGPFCFPDYSSGVCACLCVDPKCMLEGCPEGQQCLPTGECDTCYECLPKFDDTTTLTTTPTQTTSPCSDLWCGQFCFPDYSLGFCTCHCIDPICKLEGCPEGQQCLPTGECDTCYECLPKFETTTGTTTETTPDTTTETTPETSTDTAPDTTTDTTTETTTPCPMVTCGPDCVPETGSGGCLRCACPPNCQTVKCSAGFECQLVNVTCIRYPCFPQAQCVAIKETTTRKQCRMLKCLPTCFPGKGPDGCPSCDCPPTCQDHYCPDDEKCVLQNARCKNKRKHCFPQPTCVPKEDESCDPEA